MGVFQCVLWALKKLEVCVMLCLAEKEELGCIYISLSGSQIAGGGYCLACRAVCSRGTRE